MKYILILFMVILTLSSCSDVYYKYTPQNSRYTVYDSYGRKVGTVSQTRTYTSSTWYNN